MLFVHEVWLEEAGRNDSYTCLADSPGDAATFWAEETDRETHGMFEESKVFCVALPQEDYFERFMVHAIDSGITYYEEKLTDG